MVSLPTTRRAWQKAAGQSPHRAALIRAGAGRRRDYDARSQTARALATLLRREPQLWDVALQATFEHYGERRRVLADDDLLALGARPGGVRRRASGVPRRVRTRGGVRVRLR